MNKEKTAENATHYLLCPHGLDSPSTVSLHRPCHILKTMDDGRKKILVFSNQLRGNFDKSHIRYVCPSRVWRFPPTTEKDK